MVEPTGNSKPGVVDQNIGHHIPGRAGSRDSIAALLRRKVGSNGGDKVVNGMDNVGLFNRMNVDFALRTGGPVSYDTLAGMVRARAGN